MEEGMVNVYFIGMKILREKYLTDILRGVGKKILKPFLWEF